MMTWRKVSEELIYDGFRKILKREFEKPDGTIADFEIKREGHSACILALTPTQEVILAKEFRPGPEKVLMELPGGAIDAGEDPLSAAARELLEETGYEGDLQAAGSCYYDAYSTRVGHSFVATNCRKVAEPHLDENEQIEVALMPLIEFRAHLKSGELTDVPTGYMGLEFLGLL